MDDSEFARTPVVVYGVNLLAAATAYLVMQLAILRAEGEEGPARSPGR